MKNGAFCVLCLLCPVPKYSWPSITEGSGYSDSTNCRWKIFGEKNRESSKKQNLNLLCTGNYLHRLYIALGIISNLQMTKYTGGCAQLICKYYAILYKGLEHPWTLVLAGVLEPIPCRYQGKIVSDQLQSLHQLIGDSSSYLAESHQLF